MTDIVLEDSFKCIVMDDIKNIYFKTNKIKY